MEQKSFKSEKIATLFPKSATEEDMKYCLAVAEEYNLSPIKKEVFFIERKQKVDGQWSIKIEPLIGRDGFLSIAHKTEKFGGMETTVEIKEIPKMKNGEWVYEKDLIARCTVYRKDSDKPFITEVAYSEYVQLKSDGSVTGFWFSKPKTMLCKVAESQCLRKAFNISGIYSAEEIGYGSYADNGELVQDVTNKNPESDESSSKEVIKTLESAGVEYELKDGWVGVNNGYKHKELLTQLGFTYIASKKYYVLKL